MREVIALEALDLNNDPELQAIESNLSLIDYAIESASFEIELGNEEFGRVLEAANSKKSATGDSWFKQVTAKVSSFVNKIIAFFRSQLDRIKSFFTAKKAKADAASMKKKVAIGAAGAAGAVAVGAGLYALLKHRKTVKAADDMKLLNEGIEAAKKGTESYEEWKEKRIRDEFHTDRDMETGIRVDVSRKELYKQNKELKQYKATTNEIMQFMNENVSSAQDLNKFVNQAYSQIKGLAPDLQPLARKALNDVIAFHSGNLRNAANATKTVKSWQEPKKSAEDLMNEADEENGEAF